MGIFSCILHRRILGTLAGRHKNSRAAISPAFAAGRAHGRRGAAVAVILKGEFHSDAVRGTAAPERLGAGTYRCGVNGWPAQERPGNGETPGNIGRLWAGRRSRRGLPLWTALRRCGGERCSSRPRARATGRGGGRTRGWAAGRPIFAPETVSAPFGHFMSWKWCGPRKTPVRAPESL